MLSLSNIPQANSTINDVESLPEKVIKKSFENDLLL